MRRSKKTKFHINDLALKPGINKFKVFGIEEFGTVTPREYTEGGYPKNTVTELGEITLEFDVDSRTFRVVDEEE
jgi:hypothetical protein